MRYKLASLIGLLVLSAVILFAKFYTAEVYYRGDPTVAVVVKKTPSMDNYFQLTRTERFEDFTVLIIDENSYVGEEFYRILTGWLWLVLLSVFLFFGFYLLRSINKSRKARGHPL